VRGAKPLFLAIQLSSSTPLPFSVKGIPQSTVHESLTTEYLFVVSWAILILFASLAKKLLKVLPVKVVDCLTAEVF